MPTTFAHIKLWLSPDESAPQTDIKLHHSSGQVSQNQTYLSLAIVSLPKVDPIDEYLPATQWVNRLPYRSTRNDDDKELLLPSGPLLVAVALVTNLRGWVTPDDICVRELQVNSTAATRLRPQSGKWQLGYEAERQLVIEEVKVQEDMAELIDPSKSEVNSN